MGDMLTDDEVGVILAAMRGRVRPRRRTQRPTDTWYTAARRRTY